MNDSSSNSSNYFNSDLNGLVKTFYPNGQLKCKFYALEGKIDKFCFLASGSSLLGNCHIEKKVFIGSDCTILPKIKVEIVISDELTDDVIDVIKEKAQTGRIGDGKIFISTVDETVRIRTGETGKKAI